MQTTDNDNLGGTALPAADETQIEEQEPFNYNPPFDKQPDDIPDEAGDLPTGYDVKSEGSSESDV
jgi:hypothetical protein